MTAPTPEEFLAQTGSDEDDYDESPEVVALPGRVLSPQNDPLASIAESLASLLAIVVKNDAAEETDDRLNQELAELEDAYRLLEEQKEEAWALIAQVLEVCKPSVSQLANKVRAVLEQPVEPPEPAAQPEPLNPDDLSEHPAHEAPVEEWRAYAKSKGYLSSGGVAVDDANRSQIRSMLGIAQPVAVKP